MVSLSTIPIYVDATSTGQSANPAVQKPEIFGEKLAHYSDVIMGTIASQITSRFFRRRSKKTSKLRVTGLYAACGEFTGDRWIARTNGQLRGKCFHLITSSCHTMVADFQTFCVKNTRPLVFCEDGYQLPAPSRCRKITSNASEI